MPTQNAGRVTLIIVVLFAALFGVYITDGIFAVRPFATDKPKISLNLKPGIDIAGGYSLTYEIKKPEGWVRSTENTLAEQVAAVLKKRVDPGGVRNLIWRPQGDDRLEIQLPRASLTAEGTSKVKDQYTDARNKLAQYNVNYAQVVNAVEIMKGDERAKELDRLATPQGQILEPRRNLFAVLASQYDKMKGIEAQLAEVKKAAKPDEAKVLQLSQQLAQARIAYNDEKTKIESYNLAVSDVEALIENPNEQNNAQLTALKTKYPERKPLIDKLHELYPQFQKSKGSIDDVADLKRLLRGSGLLEFHILATPPGAGREPTITQDKYQEMVDRMQQEGPVVKAGDETRWYEIDRTPEEFGYPTVVNPRNGKHYALAWVTPDKSMTHTKGSGEQDWALERAFPTQGNRGMIVGFQFDATGGARFSTLTGNNIGRPLGTILDGRIITAPNIRSQIGSSGTIEAGSKGYSQSELDYLVSTLSAGSLPAQLEDEPISERVVGPQLGASNLRAGLYACVVGLIVAATFLVVYYHLAGFIAVFGLVMNLVLILGVSAMMGATFTLPGIAALVLATGMAVDANVLIFERLREEQMRGLSLKLALRNAYDRAWTAILDSNVTTAITSAFLIYFGSEEVKGFGLTLLVGILASMFGALFVTKTIFAVMLNKFGLRKLGSLPLSLPWWNNFLHPKIDWMAKVKYFAVFSIVFVVLGLTAFVQRTASGKMFDVEFQSGTEVQFTLKEPMSDADVRAAIDKQRDKIPQPSVVAVGEAVNGKATEFSVVTSNANRKDVSDAIVDALKDKLNVAVQSKFEAKDAEIGEAIGQGIVMPVQIKDGKFQVGGRDIPDALQYPEGVAVNLKNIDPPLRPEEIHSRISRALLAVNNNTLGQFTVVRTDGQSSEQAPTSSAVVLISNPNFAYSKSETDWREKLAAPFWTAVKEGVNKPATLSKVINIDAQVAGDTQRDALMATILSIVGIMAYIWVRFGDHKYGTATIFAMIHDTVLVIGAIGLSHWLAATALGRALGVEAFRVNMTLVAAVLTVMSYSMVDTIVVFDRIRENRGKYGTITRTLINDSINQTLSRTVLTAGTTLATLFVMYIWGGSAIHGFTFILLIGIIIGTYSSIAIAAPILLLGAREQAAGKRQTPARVATAAAGAQVPAAPAGAVSKAAGA
jgi:SecD/SecF fusion protein